MTDPAPHRVIDCTYTELEPAVIDVTGAVIRPPVIKPPDEYDVPAGGDVAVNVTTGETHDLADLPLEPLEPLEAWHARQQAATDAAAEDATRSAASAWVELRMIRDRWLDQMQVVFDAIAAPGAHDLPGPMAASIDANADCWDKWRQAMRDLPEQPDLDAEAAVAAIRAVHATSDEWPSPWPQPPAAPVKYLS